MPIHKKPLGAEEKNQSSENDDQNNEPNKELYKHPPLQIGMPPLPTPIEFVLGMGGGVEIDTLKPFGVEKARSEFAVSGKGMVVAVIDTGVNQHPDIQAARIIKKIGIVNPLDIDDKYGHGTHVAGIIAGSRGLEISPGVFVEGVAPEAEIVSIKVTKEDSYSSNWAFVANGLNKVMEYNTSNPEKKITVVNLSFNGFDMLRHDWRMRHHRVRKLICELSDSNIPVVISAGNSFRSFKRKRGVGYPANFKSVIAVGAVDIDQVDGSPESIASFATFSQRNYRGFPWIFPQSKLLLAPGVDTISTYYRPVGGREYGLMSGTSAAAPFVTGVILLMQEYYLRMNHRLPAVSEIVKALQSGSRRFQNLLPASGSMVERVAGMNAGDRRHFFDGRTYRMVNAQESLRNLAI